MLLALGAQALADNYRWGQDVARSKADLDAEILGNIQNGAERVAVAPCLSARIKELGEAIGGSSGDWRAMPFRPVKADANSNYTMPVVYRMPSRVWTTDVWEQAKGMGLFNHMKAQDLRRYSGVYEQIGDLRRNNEDERRQAPKLSFLGFDGRLEPAARVQALTTLAELDAHNRMIVLIAGQVATVGTWLEGRLLPSARSEFADVIKAQRQLRGNCVDAAAGWRILAPLMPGQPVRPAE